MKWIKWTNEEHILCSDEFSPLKTSIATVILNDKNYNLWSIWINDLPWNEQPLESKEINGLSNAKKEALQFINNN
jgi:hypothetical protein